MKAKRLVRGYFRHIVRYAGYGMVATALLSVALPSDAGAVTTLSQGYFSNDPLAQGSLVSLETNSSDEVAAADSNNVDGLFGVVINPDSSLLQVVNGQKSQVQVATTGTVQVLVSDINGKIARGDHITASPIAGVGMKASGNVRVIGIAQNDMGPGSKQTYKDKGGHEHTAAIGEVPVLVNVAYFFKEPEKTLVPTAVQNVANALAGRQVSTTPVLISAGIFLVTLIVVVSIIYSMIKSSIISVGRNPMSQSAIYRELIQMSALVLAILGVGFGAIYLVLTRL